jgi:two-component sensor histidine kinase/putative methionine-R-sulfoxide reductase with GAF domain
VLCNYFREISLLWMNKVSISSLEERVVRMYSYQQVLASLGRAASEALPPQRLMHHVAAQVSRVTHIKRTKVLRYRPNHADLLMEAGVGWRKGLVGHATFGIDIASPAGRSVQTGRPVVVANLQTDPEFRTSEVLRDHGIVSLVNVPIFTESRTWGVLEVDSETERDFDEGDVTFLITVANILGIAIRHYETQQRALDEVAEFALERLRAETMRQELQHRVKNNFQTIISFLSIQRREASSPEASDRLSNVINLVHTIALAHDQLAPEENAGQVEFSAYLSSLCLKLDPQQEEIMIKVVVGTGANLLLPLDRAVTAALIMNELVTNSLKYAFDHAGGTVTVSFSVDHDLDEASLIVADDGRGMDSAAEEGMGTKLVQAFAEQLHGRVIREAAAKGTLTRINFPLPT